MIYNTIWFDVTPSQRDLLLASLKRLGQIVQAETGAAFRLSTHVNAKPFFRIGIATQFNDKESRSLSHTKLQRVAAYNYVVDRLSRLSGSAMNGWCTLNALHSGTVDTADSFVSIVGISASPSHLQSARKHMAEIAEHYQRMYGCTVDVLVDEAIDPTKHYLMVNYASLQQYDRVQASLATDVDYDQWVAGTAGIFDSVRNELSIGCDHVNRKLASNRPVPPSSTNLHFESADELIPMQQSHQPFVPHRFLSLHSM